MESQGELERRATEREQMMKTEEAHGLRRLKGGHYCTAPGCKNDFYRAKAMEITVHFHKPFLKGRGVLLRWLAALKG